MGRPKKVEDAEIIAVLADPTIHKKAEALGITPQGLWERLHKNPNLWDITYQVIKANVRAELAPIYHALIQKAKKGDVGAANTLLKALGELVDRCENKTKLEGEVKLILAADINDTDARRIATALLARREKE